MENLRWTNEKELKKILSKVEVNSEIQKSGIPMAYENEKNIFIEDSGAHSLVIGAAGSGKTQSVVLPQVRLAINAGESFLINDIKGEILNKVGGKLKEKDYNIIILDYNNFEVGNHYNVLSFPYKLYQNNNKDNACEMLESIAHYLMHDPDNNIDPFWEKTSMDYFVGLALYTFENAKEEEINLNSIYNLSNAIVESEELGNKIMNSLSKNSSTYIYLSTTLNSPLETRGGIFATFSQKLNKFISKDNLSNMMATTDFNIEDIANKKTAIFVISGTSTITNNMLPILFEQVYYSLDKQENKRRFNIIFDDFDSLQPIKDFYIKLNYARGINIKITSLIKSLTSLDDLYGENNKNLIRMCFSNIIYLFANDLYTLEEISKLCGNVNNKPLITIEELRVINHFEEVIIMPRMYPVRTTVLPDYKINWNFTDKEYIPNKLNKVEIKYFNIK